MTNEIDRPTRFELPDLSGLETNMIGAWVLSAIFRRPYASGRAAMLLPTLVRSVEVALRAYEAARRRLERSIERDSLIDYMHGISDMELAVIALNRAIRIAVRLTELPETKVKKSELPSATEIEQLRKIRVAIEHVDDSVINEDRGNKGETLALNVRTAYMVIHDKDKVLQRVDHVVFSTWLSTLHAVSKSLVHDPERWASVGP